MNGTGSHDTSVKEKFYSREMESARRGAVGLSSEPLYATRRLYVQAEVMRPP